MEKFKALLTINPSNYPTQLLDEAWQQMTKYPPLAPEDLKFLDSILTQLKTSPDAWVLTETILSASAYYPSKMMVLSILQTNIRSRWPSFSPGQKIGVKKFLVNYILASSSTNALPLRSETEAVLNSANLALVAVISHEWPSEWGSFLDELLNSSTSSLGSCINTLGILKELTEQIFSEDSGRLTSSRRSTMKRGLAAEFSKINSFFSYLFSLELGEARDPILLSLFETLCYFLSWIPLRYVFESDIIPSLLQHLDNDALCDSALSCLCEVIAIRLDPLSHSPQYLETMMQLFTRVTLITLAPSPSPVIDDSHLQKKVLFMTRFLESAGNLRAMEERAKRDAETDSALKASLSFLIKCGYSPEEETFRLVHVFLSAFMTFWFEAPSKGPALFSSPGASNQKVMRERIDFYSLGLLVDLLHLLLSTKVRPKEVIVVLSSDQCKSEGKVRVRLQGSDCQLLDAAQKNALRRLSALIPGLAAQEALLYLESGALEKVHHASWAIAALSGVFDEERETELAKKAVKALLEVVLRLDEKGEKALVAGDIMLICRSYTPYLERNPRFTQVVIFKLFEFFEEEYEGVQEMAVETFFEICRSLGASVLSTAVSAENFTFNRGGAMTGARLIELILRHLGELCAVLRPVNERTFVEAVALVVAGEQEFKRRDRYVRELFSLRLGRWNELIAAGERDSNSLLAVSPELGRICGFFAAASEQLGLCLRGLIGEIVRGGCLVYRVYASYFTSIGHVGVLSVGDKEKRAFMGAFLDFLCVFFRKVSASSYETSKELLREVAPVIGESVVARFGTLGVEVRPPGVLRLLEVAVGILPESALVGGWLEALLPAGLGMITGNFEDHPEVRAGVFDVLGALVGKSFGTVAGLPKESARTILDTLVWGLRHLDSGICRGAAQSLIEFNKKVGFSELESFYYLGFFEGLLIEVMGIILVNGGEGCKKEYYGLFRDLISVIEGGKITLPVNEDAKRFGNNKSYFLNKLNGIMKEAFRNVQGEVIEKYLSDMFRYSNGGNGAGEFEKLVDDFVVISKQLNI